MSFEVEKKLQEQFPWERSKYFPEYNAILGYYQADSCIELGHGPCILDLPCGDGTLTKIFTEHFDRVVGVDASKTHLVEARKRAPNAEYHLALIEELDIDEKFDSIFMINILEHVLDPVVALKHAASFLKKDGILIAHVPNAEAVNRKIAVLMGTLLSCEELSPFDKDIAGHRRYYTLDILIRDLEQAGLYVTSTGGIFYKMLSTPQIDWLLSQGPWEEGGFGWGRVGSEKNKNWKAEFCHACYEFGKERPHDCNVVYACAVKKME
jgi:2-polyprenyl-3-methyl-5-hydroxy-6-metoxy-1,4-benzoquinol methylase